MPSEMPEWMSKTLFFQLFLVYFFQLKRGMCITSRVIIVLDTIILWHILRLSAINFKKFGLNFCAWLLLRLISGTNLTVDFLNYLVTSLAFLIYRCFLVFELATDVDLGACFFKLVWLAWWAWFQVFTLKHNSLAKPMFVHLLGLDDIEFSIPKCFVLIYFGFTLVCKWLMELVKLLLCEEHNISLEDSGPFKACREH